MRGRLTLAVGVLVIAVVAFAALLGAGERSAANERREAGDWDFAPSMSQRRSYVAAAELDGRIYVAGGMVGESGRHLATFDRFDAEEQTWTTLRRLPEPVRAGAAAAVGDVVYVIGGSTPSGGGRQVWAYDAAAGTWQARARLPEPRLNHAAVALDGRIYVLGGFVGARAQDDVLVYDPTEDGWSRAAPLPRPAHAFATVVFDGA
ncbi:MAG: hypothetical protein KY396_06395, partial [Actinobacteria bacterium]|nr:hypothetical protein [Actinomycetota bacterium]